MSKKQSDFKEKAEKDNLRLLEKICNKMDFHMVLLGNIYCSLKTNEKIYCRFRAQKKDHNGLYPCLNQRWYPNNPGAYH